MKPTLASYIDFLTPFISPDLISDPYLNRIRTIAERLPVLSLGSFECWLAENEPRVDFNVCINPRVNEHIRMRDWRQDEVSFESDTYREMRERIRSFCATWSQDNFFLKPLLGELWEVYDMIDLNEFSPVPWVYISFLKNFLANDPAVKAEIIVQVLPFINSKLPSDITEKFYAILRTIPPSIRVGTIGINNRNNHPSIRLYVEINTFEELIQFLEKQHWLGNIDELRQKMKPWVESRHYFGLALDFNGVFQPKIGIECHLRPEKWEEDITIFTHHLCEHELCSIDKRNAFLNWNGIFEVETPLDYWSWPDRIKVAKALIPKMVSIKKTAFIKLVFEPNMPLIAKGYPMFLRPVLRSN